MENRKHGLSERALKIWGLGFTLLWIAGRTLSRMIMKDGAGEVLAEKLDSIPYMMPLATVILILEAAATCAVPVFAALTLEGVGSTRSFGRYALRVALLALVSEIPYDLLMTGSYFSLSVQNPAFGILVCLAVVYFFNRYEGKSFQELLIRSVVILAAAAWCLLGRVEYGMQLLLCVTVLWIFRRDRSRWGLAAMMGAALSILFSPFFLAAPMGAILLHFYNGERGEGSRRGFYLVFPLALLAGGLVSLAF